MIAEFIWRVRVYYEDTDAAGVVFYANYLRYMERARTEWLRSIGFEQSKLVNENGVLFAVKHVTINYIKPCRLDDQLAVSCQLLTQRHASLVFEQHIKNEKGELLSQASVKIVCLDAKTLTVAPLPETLLGAIT